MRAALAILLLALACGGKAAPAPVPPADATCDDAARGIARERVDDPVAADVPAELIAQEKAAMTPVIGDVCAADAWTAETIGCFTVARDDAEVDACAKALSDDQQAHLAAALDEADAVAAEVAATSDADE